MRVLLIRPRQIHWKNEEKRVAQPLGLLYLAGTLREVGHEVGFVDETVEGYDNEREIKRDLFEYGLSDSELENKIKEFSPNVVGIESNFTYFWNQVKNLASLVKKIDNKIITVVGGHHVSGVEQGILQQNKDIDYIISKEGETKFLELINSFDKPRQAVIK